MCGPRPARKQPPAIHGMPGPYARSNAKTLRFQPVLVRLQELESWAL